MAIKKKPVLRKAVGKAAPKAKAPAETESDAAAEAGAADEDEFAPAPVNSRDVEHGDAGPAVQAGGDDGLVLQETPEIDYPGEKFKRPRKKPPTQNKGSSLDVHDTSKLLLLAWVVIGAVVAISVYMLLVHANKSEEEVATHGEKPVAVPVAPPKVVDAKAAANDAKLTSNPANKTAFEAYMTFGKWAYTDGEASNWDGKKLSEKLDADVKLGNVDDPDVKELVRLQAENFKLMNSHPLRPYEESTKGTGEISHPNDSGNLATYKQNENKIKGLTVALRQRYGVGLK